MNEIRTSGLGNLTVGRQCSIGRNVTVIFHRPAEVILGDYVSLGDDVKLVVDGGNVSLGDWTTVHSGSLILSKEGVEVGPHCWFGQNTILDGTGGLHVEHGVRIGMYSQVWSHVAAGEQIEGCTLFGESPVHIGADAWLVGSCMVAPGVTVGRRTVALAGSNLTRSCEDNIVVAGAPAQRKEKLSFYKSISLDEKFALLRTWLVAMVATTDHGATLSADSGELLEVSFPQGSSVRFYKTVTGYQGDSDASIVTRCCVENKCYEKTWSDAEKITLKYLSGNKARFYSVGEGPLRKR